MAGAVVGGKIALIGGLTLDENDKLAATATVDVYDIASGGRRGKGPVDARRGSHPRNHAQATRGPRARRCRPLA